MNQVRRQDRDVEEIARISGIVERHSFPDFVTGFSVRLGEFDGDPAMWIIFKRSGDDALDAEVLKQRAKVMNDFTHRVQSDLLAEIDDRYPYFRSEPAEISEKR